MKIKKLWVSRYKNIENIDLGFDSNQITLLVGKNGLGKSNLIEILAIIFKELDLNNDEDYFKNWAYLDGNFEFEIQYECMSNEILIKLKKELFEISTAWIGSNSFSPIYFKEFKRNKSIFLPKYIIGYYSGENKRLGKIIEAHERIELRRLKYRQKKPTADIEELRKIFFSKNTHSHIILLTLALYKEFPTYNKIISELLNDYLNIEEIKNFSIRFNNPRGEFDKFRSIENLFSNINDNVEFPFWNVKGKLDKLLTRLYNHQVDLVLPKAYDNEGRKEDKRGFVKEFIEFDQIEFKRFIEELINYFPHPIDFFSALEAAQVLEILNKISFVVKKKNEESLISFDSLSEGEQQLLTVLGLLLITGKDDCLFLLDEPDTHLNPDWQRDYVSHLMKFDLNAPHSHIIVATHSPLIVQAAEKAQVFLFKKTSGKISIDQDDHMIKNWRIDHVLASEYFGLESTRPPYLDSFMKKREKLLSKKELSDRDLKIIKDWNNNFEALPTGETITDLKVLRLAYKLINDLNESSDD